MRRKYGDCTHPDGDCTSCSLVSYGMDCHGKQITKTEWQRRAAGLSQQKLADAAGLNIRQIQKIEAGEVLPENMLAKSLFALADALGIDAKELL